MTYSRPSSDHDSGSIPGHATSTGTQRYRDRHSADCHVNHFRDVTILDTHQLTASSIGVGTYLGQVDDETDTLMEASVVQCVQHGINVIDTAINYRYQRSELSVGKGIRQLIEAGTVSRDEIIVCTKGGFIPHADRANWFQQRYGESSSMKLKMTDVVAQSHCMHPVYLRDQLQQSLANLGLETIDIYYVHNPETQLTGVTPHVFYDRLKAAFEALEQAVELGQIKAYGLATWNAFRVSPQAKDHVDLNQVVAIAQSVAGNKPSHFRYIQLPLNLAMPEALVLPTQTVDGEQMPALAAAHHLGLTTIASASISQAKVIGKIPAAIESVLGKPLSDQLSTDGQRALQFTRSAPNLLTALVGMKRPNHVSENLELCKISPLDADRFRSWIKTLS